MSADPDGPQPERQGRLRLAALAVLLVGGAGLIGLLARSRPTFGDPLPSRENQHHKKWSDDNPKQKQLDRCSDKQHR